LKNLVKSGRGKARIRSGEANERSFLVDFNIMLTVLSASDFDFVKTTTNNTRNTSDSLSDQRVADYRTHYRKKFNRYLRLILSPGLID